MDPRIRTALALIHPTAENPDHHGAPTHLGVLRGVSAAVAVWRPYAEANNLREIALHIAIWENSVANRISGKNQLVGLKQWKFGWVLRSDTLDGAQWKEELEMIQANHQRLVAAVTNFDPALLDQIVGKKTILHAVDHIFGVGEHSLYHSAQMEMLKTLAKQNGIE